MEGSGTVLRADSALDESNAAGGRRNGQGSLGNDDPATRRSAPRRELSVFISFLEKQRLVNRDAPVKCGAKIKRRSQRSARQALINFLQLQLKPRSFGYLRHVRDARHCDFTALQSCKRKRNSLIVGVQLVFSDNSQIAHRVLCIRQPATHF